MSSTPIIIENQKFRLEIGQDAKAKSLMIKSNGRECLKLGANLPMFSVTQLRPYNNEIKLAYPNVKMEFNAKSVSFDGENLSIAFDLVPYKAIVKVNNQPTYVQFQLVDFIMEKEQRLRVDYPPVEEFRIIQLPIKDLDRYGEWLNVMHDDEIAVNVLGASPYPLIKSVKGEGHRILSADARRGIKLKGCSAVLIATEKDNLLDVIDTVEQDFNLPRGVRSRRSEQINRSIYWSGGINPKTVDRHIELAKKGGFTKMLFYYSCMFKMEGYSHNNSFEYNDNYPNKEEDIKLVLKKINDAGIDAGMHILHTHIGIYTKYVTPEVDPRINLKQRYTLSRPLSKTDDKVYVQENPEWAPKHESCRILNFNGELMKYEGVSEEYPYHFYGVERGFNNTIVKESPVGLSGGILDISEYGAKSVYLNQNSDLQDEIAEKIANIYNLGFKFVYFDGSEGTDAPYDFHVANAQYRVYKKLKEQPLFCEGAAKTHFSWHMLSGGNAFDVFPWVVFKEKVAEHPLEEAIRMKDDFTRINFGWWYYYKGVQADYYEYGSAKAVAVDCPTTMQMDPIENFARENDILEVLRRWEDMRKLKLLTNEQKEMLKNPDKEFILLINEEGEYEICEYSQINLGEECPIKAYSFTRKGKSYVVYWNKEANGKISLPLDLDDLLLEQDLGKAKVEIEKSNGKITIPADDRKYLSTSAPIETLINAFSKVQCL